MNRVLLNTIPKSGTNMFMKLLDLLGFTCSGLIDRRGVTYRNIGRTQAMRLKMKPRTTLRADDEGYLAGMMVPTRIPSDEIEGIISLTRDRQYLQSHVGYSDKLLNEVIRRGFKVILGVRDPRALLRSRYHYVMKRKEKAPLYRWIRDMEREEAFDFLLNGFENDEVSFPSMSSIVMSIKDWDREGVFVLRYEDIVGPQGGGSQETQKKSLGSLLQYLEIAHDDRLIEKLSSDLYGGTRTFSKGNIDSWKEELNSDQITILESSLSEFMTKYGYL